MVSQNCESLSMRKVPHCLWAVEFGTRAPKATCVSIYLYAESAENMVVCCFLTLSFADVAEACFLQQAKDMMMKKRNVFRKKGFIIVEVIFLVG